MPAIPSHKTPTSDGPWDGPANEARLKTDQNYAYYRRAYAWRDPEGDEGNKATYKFIHHEVDGDGNPGAANVRACITGIAVLNGARGGTTIPRDDYQGVYNHLAAHLRDADTEPPELKSSGYKPEYRSFALSNIEIRSEDDTPKMTGHAAVFDSLSEDLGYFREKIAHGAFSKTIQEADVRALWNHDSNYVLGRTKSGTLKLWEDERGLAVEITPPDTQWAKDLLTSMKRGDVDQMSFGFQVVKDDWEETADGLVRTLREVKLFDVSPVTYPAYPATDIYARSLVDILQSYLSKEDEPLLTEHSADIELLRKKLDLLEKEI